MKTKATGLKKIKKDYKQTYLIQTTTFKTQILIEKIMLIANKIATKKKLIKRTQLMITKIIMKKSIY